MRKNTFAEDFFLLMSTSIETESIMKHYHQDVYFYIDISVVLGVDNFQVDRWYFQGYQLRPTSSEHILFSEEAEFI